jgi:hypothetical protein
MTLTNVVQPTYAELLRIAIGLLMAKWSDIKQCPKNGKTTIN